MDLLATVRKEGSRGGRGEFKWTDIQNSSHREHYLGHSLMAPVGRWQKGRDLNWYTKADTEATGEDPVEREARERREEIKQVKEAEEDALARALGLPVPERNNPNMQALGDRREVEKALKDAAEDDDDEGGKGIGFGSSLGASRGVKGETTERIEGNAEGQDRELHSALREYRRRHGDGEERHKSRSKERERKHRKHHERDRGHRHRHRSRSRDRHRRPSRSRSGEQDRDHHRRERRHEGRSRSPYRRRDDRGERNRGREERTGQEQRR